MRGRLRSVLRLGVRSYLIASFLVSPDPLPAAVNCATPGKDGAGGTLSGIVNTYYPGTADVAAGATSIPVGAARGSATGIGVADLLLVIQMRDTNINATNTTSYGSGVAGTPFGYTALRNSGLYEYVVAVSLTGGNLTITGANGGGLVNAYHNAAVTTAHGQRKFQVVRVPQYSSATLGSALTAAAWDGSTGGILAVDVSGTLGLGGATVSVSGVPATPGRVVL